MFIQMYEEKYMRFFGGKSKALTFSYDDGVKADKRLIAIFKKYGLKGTFNLNSELFDCESWHGRMDEKDTFDLFLGSGQEIAMHGARHIFLNKVPLPEAMREISKCRDFLERKTGSIIRGLAYAYTYPGERVKDALPSLGVAYARTTDSTRSFALPEDFLRWNPTCSHADPELDKISDKFFEFSPESELKNRESLLFYVWGHSYEFDDHDNWSVIENLASRAAEQKDNIWFATNGEIYDYVTAYNRLVFSQDGERVYNPSAIPVWIEVRGKVYKIDGGKGLKF